MLSGHWVAELQTNGTRTKKLFRESKTFLAGVMSASVNNYIEADKCYCVTPLQKHTTTNHITANKQHFASYENVSLPQKILFGKINGS